MADDKKDTPPFPFSYHRQVLEADAKRGDDLLRAYRELDQRNSQIIPALAASSYQISEIHTFPLIQPLMLYTVSCMSNIGPTASRLREEARIQDLISEHLPNIHRDPDDRHIDHAAQAEAVIKGLSPRLFPHIQPEDLEALLAPYVPFLTDTGFNVFCPAEKPCHDKGKQPSSTSAYTLPYTTIDDMAMGFWSTLRDPQSPDLRSLTWQLALHQKQDGGSQVYVLLSGNSRGKIHLTNVILYNALENDYFSLNQTSHQSFSSSGQRSTSTPWSPMDYFDFARIPKQLEDLLEASPEVVGKWPGVFIDREAFNAKCWPEAHFKTAIQGLVDEVLPVYDFEAIRDRITSQWVFGADQAVPTQLQLDTGYGGYRARAYVEWYEPREEGSRERRFVCRLPWKDSRGNQLRASGSFETGEVKLFNSEQSELTCFPRARAAVFLKIKHLRKFYLENDLPKWLEENHLPIPDVLVVPKSDPALSEEENFSLKLRSPLYRLYVSPEEEALWA